MQPWKLRILIPLMLLSGCATPPPEPQSMRDPAANFTAYRTFGWAPVAAPDGSDPPLQLLDKSIRAAITAEMQRKGYAESQDNPDLRIAYETAKADKIENNPVRMSVGVGGWGGGNVGGSVGVSSPSAQFHRGHARRPCDRRREELRGVAGQHLRKDDQRQRRARRDSACGIDGDARFPGEERDDAAVIPAEPCITTDSLV